MKNWIIPALAFSALLACNPQKQKEGVATRKANPSENKEKTAKNIILFIGDGTGMTQVSTLWYYGDGEPNYGRFDVTGIAKTNSASDTITDSGAGATAFSIGKKSYNGSIGVGPDSLTVRSIVELLSQKGYQTGVISTSSITHATPASFYAHVKSRNEHEEIAKQLLHSDIDYFAGGGIRYFRKRRDELNLLDSFEKAGFALDTNRLGPVPEEKKGAFLLADKALPTMVEGRGDFLPDATAAAIEYFEKSDKPFFLMVEGSQVDWGGHANDARYIITELRDLDKAVGVGLDFAEKDEETLVIAIADHETGGFALTAREVKTFGGGSTRNYNAIDPKFTSGGHSCAHVPVFASGPGAILFTGVFENEDLFVKMLGALGLERETE